MEVDCPYPNPLFLERLTAVELSIKGMLSSGGSRVLDFSEAAASRRAAADLDGEAHFAPDKNKASQIVLHPSLR